MSLAGSTSAGVSVAPRRPHPVRAPVPLVLLGGLVLGLLWRLALPAATAVGDPGEADAAHDSSFIVLAAGAGLLTAVALWRRPGSGPALRFALVLVTAVAASALAVGVARLAGAPALTAWGALLVWPTVTAVVVAASLVYRLLIRPA